MIKEIIVTDALLEHNGKIMLHPELAFLEISLLKRRQQWSRSAFFTPLSYYADRIGQTPASLMANMFEAEGLQFAQYWIASPFHARMTRASLNVLPDSKLEIEQEAALAIVDVLQPYLKEDGLRLLAKNGVLLLGCEKVWDVAPQNLAEISGSVLPNTLPSGKDAGKWMRLISEIQMILFQNPILSANDLPIHGLWIWGAGEGVASLQSTYPVATRHPSLWALSRHVRQDTDASICISEADNIQKLLNQETSLPQRITLLGSGLQVRLTKSLVTACLSLLKSQPWKGL